MTKVAARGNERGQRNPASRSGAEDLHRARRHVPQKKTKKNRYCCPHCNGILTVCPEGLVQEFDPRVQRMVISRQPFVSCNHCVAIFSMTGWNGVGQ